LEARRRRRVELARGWRFACPCKRCEEEGKGLESEKVEEEEEGGIEDGKDESKVEESLRMLEEKEKEMREGRATEVEGASCLEGN
jgi:import receptor subunit TOM20